MISVERRKESYFQVLRESTSKVLLVKIVTLYAVNADVSVV